MQKIATIISIASRLRKKILIFVSYHPETNTLSVSVENPNNSGLKHEVYQSSIYNKTIDADSNEIDVIIQDLEALECIV